MEDLKEWVRVRQKTFLKYYCSTIMPPLSFQTQWMNWLIYWKMGISRIVCHKHGAITTNTNLIITASPLIRQNYWKTGEIESN